MTKRGTVRKTPEAGPAVDPPAPSETPEVTITNALNAYGPDGAVLAQSWDGGKTWKKTEAGLAHDRPVTPVKPRQFTRKIMAVVDEPNGALARRIMTPFSVLDRANILTGWAPYQAMLQLTDQSIDGIIVPGLMTPLQLEELRRVGRTLILDLDAPQPWGGAEQERLFAMLPYLDGVIAPTPLLASRLRPYHKHVFALPHMLRQGIWHGFTPIKRSTVNVGLPMEIDDQLARAVEDLRAKHGGRILWQSFDWRSLNPVDEMVRYRDLDVVVLPQISDRTQMSFGPMLPAMAAFGTVVGDRYWPQLQHRRNGIMIMRPDAKSWTVELNAILMDGASRARIGRAARSSALRQMVEGNLGQVFLPYRILVPESAPVTIQE